MKLVILTDEISGGGAAVIAWNHAKAMQVAGFEVVVIATSPKSEEEGEKFVDGIKVHVLHSNYPALWRAWRSLNNRRVVKKVDALLSKSKPDVIHAHNIHFHLSYAALAVARKYSSRVFLTIHDSMPFHYGKLFPETIKTQGDKIQSYKVSPLEQLSLFKWQYNPFRNIIIKKYLKIPKKIFAVSSALAQALNDNGITDVEVLHNGIDVAAWQMSETEANDFKEKFKLNDRKIIFFGGRLSRAKGGEVLLAALKKIAEKEPKALLLVVGEKDRYAESMLRQAEGLDLSNHLIFTGWLSQQMIKNAYAVSTVVAVPSLCFDWFPTVILEAMACKKAVMGGCFGGASEMVKDSETGYIVDPRNIEKLSETIIKLLSGDNRAAQFGQAGYNRVASEFTLKSYVETLRKWYTEASDL